MKNIFKVFSLFLVLFLLFSCAKPSEPASVEGSLNIENIFEISGYAMDISVTDSHLYIAEDQAGYSIYDLATNDLISHNESYIEELNTVLFENVRAITVVEDENILFAYEQYGADKGINMFDLADKANPAFIFRHGGNTTSGITQLESNISTEGGSDIFWTNGATYNFGRFDQYWYGSTAFTFQNSVGGFDIGTNRIYVSAEQLGFHIVDKSNGDLISTTDTDGVALDVKIVDNYLIVALRQAGFAVYDVSDSLATTLVCQKEVNEYIYTIDVEGDNMVLGSHNGGVYLYDISDLENPVLVGNINSDKIGYTYEAVIKNNKIYAATRQGVYKIGID